METADRLALVDQALLQLRGELVEIIKKHRSFSGPHEAWAVIREEVDELWDEVKADRGRLASAKVEALQVAAAAIRFFLEVPKS